MYFPELRAAKLKVLPWQSMDFMPDTTKDGIPIEPIYSKFMVILKGENRWRRVYLNYFGRDGYVLQNKIKVPISCEDSKFQKIPEWDKLYKLYW